MPDEAWTAEHIDLLKTLWAAGETATTIASRLGGLSRSAVLGKIFRLRLGAAGAKESSAFEQKVAAKKKSKSPAANTQVSGRPAAKQSGTRSARDQLARRRRGKRDTREQSPPAARSPFKTLFELTNHTCRWPHGRPGSGKFFFCGAAGADLERGIPYCPSHMRRAYTVPDWIVAEERQAVLEGLRFARSSGPARTS